MLTQNDREAIDAAIKNAGQTTTARIRVAVVPASYHYREFILFDGFFLGGVIGLVSWGSGFGMNFPELLVIQFAVVCAFALTPLGHLCIRLLPQKLKRRHAEHRAYLDYSLLHAHMQQDVPFAFLFVSLAERYVHVITSPALHRKIPDNWNAVTDQFAANMRKEGLRDACIKAVMQIGEITKNFQS